MFKTECIIYFCSVVLNVGTLWWHIFKESYQISPSMNNFETSSETNPSSIHHRSHPLESNQPWNSSSVSSTEWLSWHCLDKVMVKKKTSCMLTFTIYVRRNANLIITPASLSSLSWWLKELWHIWLSGTWRNNHGIQTNHTRIRGTHDTLTVTILKRLWVLYLYKSYVFTGSEGFESTKNERKNIQHKHVFKSPYIFFLPMSFNLRQPSLWLPHGSVSHSPAFLDLNWGQLGMKSTKQHLWWNMETYGCFRKKGYPQIIHFEVPLFLETPIFLSFPCQELHHFELWISHLSGWIDKVLFGVISPRVNVCQLVSRFRALISI